MRYDHEECLNHIEEQNAIIKNLQLLQDETQLSKHKTNFKKLLNVISYNNLLVAHNLKMALKKANIK